MIELQLLVKNGTTEVRVFDNLVFSEKAFWKIDEFRVATGEKLVEGQKVNFEAEDCVDRKGRCHLFVDVYEGRSRNKVEAYLPPSTPAAQAGPNPAGPTGSGGGSGGEPDDINFSPDRG